MDTLPPTNHIFVDFENVHEVDLSLIGQMSVHVTVLVGAKQTKLDAELVEKLVRHADSVNLVRLLEPGRNAIDFTLAYYVGRAAVLDPSGYFHIISGDTGYDPLIAHLRRNHVKAQRHENFETIKAKLNNNTAAEPAAVVTTATDSIAKPVPSPKIISTNTLKVVSLDEQAVEVLEHLRGHPKNRPAKEATLAHHISSLLGKGATGEDVHQVVQALRDTNKISINERGRVTYLL